MLLFFLFIGVPLIEIALFIRVGGAIGLGWTLAIVVLTAFAGARLIRAQGALAMRDLRRSFHEMRDPAEPLAHGAMILLAGALLLTPGFFTDTLGLALLIPPIRRAILRQLGRHVRVQGFAVHARGSGSGFAAGPGGDDIIDGEFEEVDPAARPPHPGGHLPGRH